MEFRVFVSVIIVLNFMNAVMPITEPMKLNLSYDKRSEYITCVVYIKRSETIVFDLNMYTFVESVSFISHK
jgi:hypothetical protein